MFLEYTLQTVVIVHDVVFHPADFDTLQFESTGPFCLFCHNQAVIFSRKRKLSKSYRKRRLYLSLITDVNIFYSSPISLKPSIVTFAISTFHYYFNISSSQSFMLCLSVMVFYKDLAASWLFHFLSAVFSIFSLNQTVFHLYQYLHQ